MQHLLATCATPMLHSRTCHAFFLVLLPTYMGIREAAYFILRTSPSVMPVLGWQQRAWPFILLGPGLYSSATWFFLIVSNRRFLRTKFLTRALVESTRRSNFVTPKDISVERFAESTSRSVSRATCDGGIQSSHATRPA
ncbi:hypothetical protein BDW02DRAFT_100708 [Decorospora gaudefroyi]|uniref:Uncharacterized protein n=1 Tax=Decorospora gaudefroyi TaxID=184978 RepID=A0A6A5K324_9PLEO|nr:hypothetical protein BDW02DRAFT_100708 [Decorospora gaudefroyi]